MSEQIIAEDRWGQITFYDEWNSLELRWLPATAEATDGEVKNTMELCADEAVKRRPHTLIVDTTEFRHQWGRRDDRVAQRANHPPLQRGEHRQVRFRRQPQLPRPDRRDRICPSTGRPANFPTGWFKSRQAAYEWLAK